MYCSETRVTSAVSTCRVDESPCSVDSVSYIRAESETKLNRLVTYFLSLSHDLVKNRFGCVPLCIRILLAK